jgi:hypothetical protein
MELTNTLNITVTVMAHPKRKLQAEYLASILKLYPFKEVTITWDQVNEEWHTGERALRAGIGKGQWHCVIQDDAILTPFFYENLEGAIKNVPSKSLISLYTGTARPLGKRVKLAVDKAYHATWLSYWLLMWGVGLVIPSDHIEPMLDFVKGREEPYDTRIGIFYQRNRLPVYYTMPSLVDHDDELGSLLDHGKGPAERVAHRVADDIIKWNREVIDI